MAMVLNVPNVTAEVRETADLCAIRSALRDIRIEWKRPAEHPYRDQALIILRESREMIDRINAAS